MQDLTLTILLLLHSTLQLTPKFSLWALLIDPVSARFLGEFNPISNFHIAEKGHQILLSAPERCFICKISQIIAVKRFRPVDSYKYYYLCHYSGSVHHRHTYIESTVQQWCNGDYNNADLYENGFKNSQICTSPKCLLLCWHVQCACQSLLYGLRISSASRTVPLVTALLNS